MFILEGERLSYKSWVSCRQDACREVEERPWLRSKVRIWPQSKIYVCEHGVPSLDIAQDFPHLRVVAKKRAHVG